MSGFRGKAPGAGSGEMSRRTQQLRPAIALDPKESTKARRLRRAGAEPSAIAEALGVPGEEVASLEQRAGGPVGVEVT